MGALIFLGVAVAILVSIHLYLWKRLVRDPLRPGRWRRIGGVAIAIGGTVTLATLFAEPVLAPEYHAVLAWPGYTWLGVVFYLLLFLLLLEAPVLVAWLLIRRRHRKAAVLRAGAIRPAGTVLPADVDASVASGEPVDQATTDGGRSDPASGGECVDPSRRRVLRQGAAIVAGVGALAVSGYGVSQAFAPPRVTRITVPVSRLDPRAEGLRVAVVGDIHVGPMLGAGHTERIVEHLNRLDADLVAIVGDLVSSEVERVHDALLPLRALESRYGSFFVTGNHEYYVGHDESVEFVEELGVRVLRNQRVEIAHRGGAVDLAGVNDPEGELNEDPADFEAALGDRDQSRPVLLLAHQPVAVHQAADYGVDLQLSGHTHGGQLYPFDYMVRLEQPVVSGLAEVDGTSVFVTNGAGFWGPPMRVGAPPEIGLIELRSR